MTSGDAVGRADCVCCLNRMKGHDLKQMCRWYGLPLSPELESDCRKFVMDYMLADTVRPWCGSAWRYDAESRN